MPQNPRNELNQNIEEERSDGKAKLPRAAREEHERNPNRQPQQAQRRTGRYTTGQRFADGRAATQTPVPRPELTGRNGLDSLPVQTRYFQGTTSAPHRDFDYQAQYSEMGDADVSQERIANELDTPDHEADEVMSQQMYVCVVDPIPTYRVHRKLFRYLVPASANVLGKGQDGVVQILPFRERRHQAIILEVTGAVFIAGDRDAIRSGHSPSIGTSGVGIPPIRGVEAVYAWNSHASQDQYISVLDEWYDDEELLT